MNTLTNIAVDTGYSLSSHSERLIKELSDRNSVWYDLKVTEMSGEDYVFAPEAVCRQFNSAHSLSIFLSNIQTILGSTETRTTLISYWHDRYKEIHFEKYNLKWAGNVAIDWKKNLLNNTPQMDFIHMLYNHCEQLVVED